MFRLFGLLLVGIVGFNLILIDNPAESSNNDVKCPEGPSEFWNNCYGAKNYENGSVYEGTWKNGKAEGNGTKTYKSGSKYVGQFLNDKRHGKGIYYYAKGNRYEGDWVNNKRTGIGLFTWSNGDSYVGEFKNSRCLSGPLIAPLGKPPQKHLTQQLAKTAIQQIMILMYF